MQVKAKVMIFEDCPIFKRAEPVDEMGVREGGMVPSERGE